MHKVFESEPLVYKATLAALDDDVCICMLASCDRMTSGVKDVTFWVRDEQPRIMAATCDNGTCNLYDADAGTKLCQLQPPKGACCLGLEHTRCKLL